jgi:DNA-binding protein YbaB
MTSLRGGAGPAGNSPTQPGPGPIFASTQGGVPGSTGSVTANADKPSPLIQQELADAQGRISIFGNGTPSDKAIVENANAELKFRQNQERAQQIQAELTNMPRPEQRSLAQTAYARSLEKELKDAQTRPTVQVPDVEIAQPVTAEQDAEALSEMVAALKSLPPPEERTLQQQAAARLLEKKIRDLK